MKKCTLTWLCLLAVLFLTACTVKSEAESDATESISNTAISTPALARSTITPSSTTSAEQIALTAAAKAKSETVEIDGVTYRNYFASEGLVFLNIENFNLKEPVFRESHKSLLGGWDTLYFRVDCQLDLVFRGTNSSLSGNIPKNIFCRDDQWNELQTRYADPTNFKYYYKLSEREINRISKINPKKFEELMTFSQDNAYGTGRNIAERRRLPKSATLEPSVFFYKESNDGFFCAQTMSFFKWDGELVFYRYLDDSANGFVEVSILPSALERYFRSLVNMDKSPAKFTTIPG
jgi:hypothetical protein